MKKNMRSFVGYPLIILTLLGLSMQPVYAQLEEPEVQSIAKPRTPFGEGLHNSLTGNVILNNFGFGIGGQYSRVIGPYSELTFKTGITGIRDVSEQNFQDFFTGQRIIPNKYNRALAFPFMAGLKRRLFAEKIDDNFRFFVAGSAGPVLSFVYPYLKDGDGNGFRSTQLVNIGNRQARVFTEGVNDFFSGWNDAKTKWGAAGEIKIGVDIGSNFKRQTTLEFGYMFYYFDQGLQIMEPFRPTGFNDQGQGTNPEPFFDAQKYFGTPQISIIFGGMW